MKTLRLLIVALLLCATPTFTGCKMFVNMPAETVKYYSFLDSWTISKAAYDGWCERVVSPGSTITKGSEAKVDAAWNKYRAGFQSAMVIARQDWTVATPATVLALQTELLNLIKTLTTK